MAHRFLLCAALLVGALVSVTSGAPRVALAVAATTYERVATVLLDHDAIAQLPTVAVTLAPAPGPGLVILPTHGFAVLDVTAGAYGNVAAPGLSGLSLRTDGRQSFHADWGWMLQDASAITAIPLLAPSGIAPQNGISSDRYLNTQGGYLQFYANAPLQLIAENVEPDGSGGGNYTLGHASNALRVIVLYVLYDTATGQLVPAP